MSARQPAADDALPTTAGRVPKSYSVKQRLREQLEGAPPGTALKPERALSEEFDASRSTIRQALLELAVEGRILRLQGRGTFVAPPKETLPLQLRSYTREWQERGRTPGSRLLDLRTEPAEGTVAEQLRVQPEAPVLRLERLRLTDGTPMALEVAYLEAERFAGLADRLGNDVSLYTRLAEDFGIEPRAAVETIETVMATPMVADLLDTEPGTPMLQLTRTTSDDSGTPFEFVRALYRGDRYRFVSTITPPER